MRTFIVTLILSIVLCYLAFNALSGDQGLARWTALQKQEKELILVLEGIQQEKSQVEARIQRLSPESLDLDYVEELARRKLAYARKDEIILSLEEH